MKNFSKKLKSRWTPKKGAQLISMTGVLNGGNDGTSSESPTNIAHEKIETIPLNVIGNEGIEKSNVGDVNEVGKANGNVSSHSTITVNGGVLTPLPSELNCAQGTTCDKGQGGADSRWQLK